MSQDIKDLSKEQRRTLALKKLARVFGNKGGSDVSAERSILEQVLRRTSQAEIAKLVQDRLDVLQYEGSEDSSDEEETSGVTQEPTPSLASKPLFTPSGDGTDSLKLGDKLRGLVKGSWKPSAQFLEPEYWEGISKGVLSASSARRSTPHPPKQDGSSPSLLDTLKEESDVPWDTWPSLLLHTGFLKMKGPGELFWRSTLDADLAAMAELMRTLRAEGWPPVFIYMYDAAWRALLPLYDVAASILDTSPTEVLLEPSFFAWSLQAVIQGADQGKAVVGNNFGLPHRDYSFNESWCMEDPAKPQPQLLCMWMPLVDVDITNGCLCVLPREHDWCWAEGTHPAHMRMATRPDCDGPLGAGSACDTTEVRFPLGGLRPLAPAKAGDVLAWSGNTVHMGTPCSTEAASRPRSSMALTFRRASAPPFCAAVLSPLSRDDAISLSLEKRLQLISQSLLLYSQWGLPESLPL